MTTLADLKPHTRNRVMDLVEAACINVSDWTNFKGGVAKAAANPKYCYEWAFVEADHRAVLSLWHAHMEEADGEIRQHLNIRQFGIDASSAGRRTWAGRANRMDLVIQKIWRFSLPVRVIICDGDMRDEDDDQSEASRVKHRELDPVPWAITHYDMMTGECLISRGAVPGRFVDQFTLAESDNTPPERQTHESSTYMRSREVRMRVLERAGGKCEYSGERGFKTHDGRIYLETHHVVPLCVGGPDHISNVAALCPDDHRRAHHSLERKRIHDELHGKLATPRR